MPARVAISIMLFRGDEPRRYEIVGELHWICGATFVSPCTSDQEGDSN